MKIYTVYAVPGGEDGGYGVVRRGSRYERVWVPGYCPRHISVWSAFFGSARVFSVGRSRAVLMQGLRVRVSYSRWWFFLWLYRWVRYQLRGL
jgi:hypothetical protein